MLMPRVFAFGLFLIATATTMSAMSAMPAMPAMPAMAEQMHADKSSEEQHPDPVLRKPFHDLLLNNVSYSSYACPDGL